MREANDNGAIQLFDGKKIRTAWDAQQEIWYFSIVDVISVLTDQKTTRGASTYWAVLKKRLVAEGASELLTNCKQFRALTKPATAKIALIYKKSEAIFASCVSCTCILRSLTSM